MYLDVGRSALLVSVAPPAAAEAEVREDVAERVRAAAALGALEAFLSVLVVRIPSHPSHWIICGRKGLSMCRRSASIYLKSAARSMIWSCAANRKRLSTSSVEMLTPVNGESHSCRLSGAQHS